MSSPFNPEVPIDYKGILSTALNDDYQRNRERSYIESIESQDINDRFGYIDSQDEVGE